MGWATPLSGIMRPDPLKDKLMGTPGVSSATATPQYQPFGMIRDRSQSFDPASFLRRQAFQYQRGLTDQSYGQRSQEAQAAASQGAAQAGLGGGAALSHQSDALRNVLMARAQEQGQLGAQYMGGEAQAAENEAQRAAQYGLAQLGGQQQMGLQGLQGQQQLEQLGIRGKQQQLSDILSGLFGYGTAHAGEVPIGGLSKFIEAYQAGEPNPWQYLGLHGDEQPPPTSTGGGYTGGYGGLPR